MNNKKIKQRVISLICGRFGSTFISTVIRGIENRINELKKYRIEIFSLNSMTPIETSKSINKILSENNVDGVIVISTTPDKQSLQKITRNKIPVVFVERYYPKHHCVIVDNFKAGYNAGKYLIERVRRKNIAVILDPQVKQKNSATFYRYKGFKKMLKESQINIKNIIHTYVKYHTIEDGRNSFELIYRHIKKIDAVFSVAGDMAAIGFMLEAKSYGIKFPDDIAIIGFDDVEMASAVDPPLTTIKQPILKMGEEAVNILDNVFSGEVKEPVKRILEAQLIVRETT